MLQLSTLHNYLGPGVVGGESCEAIAMEQFETTVRYAGIELDGLEGRKERMEVSSQVRRDREMVSDGNRHDY